MCMVRRARVQDVCAEVCVGSVQECMCRSCVQRCMHRVCAGVCVPAVTQAGHMGAPRLPGSSKAIPVRQPAPSSSLQLPPEPSSSPGAPGPPQQLPPAPFSKTTSSSAWATAPWGWATSCLPPAWASPCHAAPGCHHPAFPRPQTLSLLASSRASFGAAAPEKSFPFLCCQDPKTSGAGQPGGQGWGPVSDRRKAKEARSSQREFQAPQPTSIHILVRQIFRVVLKTEVHWDLKLSHGKHAGKLLFSPYS